MKFVSHCYRILGIFQYMHICIPENAHETKHVPFPGGDFWDSSRFCHAVKILMIHPKTNPHSHRIHGTGIFTARIWRLPPSATPLVSEWCKCTVNNGVSVTVPVYIYRSSGRPVFCDFWARFVCFTIQNCRRKPQDLVFSWWCGANPV